MTSVVVVSSRSAGGLVDLPLNPLGAILQQVPHTVIDPAAPSAAEVIGGAPYLLIPAGIVLGLFALGYWVFSREAPRIAEDI